jgi:hypothetical protein
LTGVAVPGPLEPQQIRQGTLGIQCHSQEALPEETSAARLQSVDDEAVHGVFEEYHAKPAQWSHDKVAEACHSSMHGVGDVIHEHANGVMTHGDADADQDPEDGPPAF